MPSRVASSPGTARHRPVYIRVTVRSLLVAVPLALAAALAARLVVGAGEHAPPLLPDLDEAPPYSVSVERRAGEYVLAFGSAVDNVGRGPLVVVGERVGSARRMIATQLILRPGGSSVARPLGPLVAYEHAETHSHWHLHGFARYELRRVDGSEPLVRARKQGFCLGDRYDSNRSRRLAGEPRVARYTAECGKGQSERRSLREGISVGYGDDYAPYLEGQFVPLSGLRARRYLLVHRVNYSRALRESDYENNASSLLIELRRPAGKPPRVRVLARCPDSATCPAS
ncbi:MAG: lysyl oxidase family protein [Actinomycetota bacterium]|nr:lysyl oxidase family protein [Actinomycetota bacterium]